MLIPCTHPDCDAEYEYEYRIRPGRPPRLWGDYPDPGEPPEVEITEADYEGEVPPCGHEQDWREIADVIFTRAGDPSEDAYPYDRLEEVE